MGILDNLVGIIIVGGVGYFAYEYYFGGGLCSGILGKTPICLATGVFDFFKSQVPTGDAGVPFVLECCECAGYVNIGLICSRCKPFGDCFTSKGCGCEQFGRLDHQVCPPDHPDKVGLLCYKSCPKGYVHTEGMPYLCRSDSKGNFWDMTGGRMFDNWKKNITGWFNFAGKIL